MKFNPIKKLKKIFHLAKEEKVKITIEDSTEILTNKSFEITTPGTENERVTTLPILEPEPEPIVKVQFVSEAWCFNCEINMIEKTEGIVFRRKKSIPKKCLVCPKCGFERRLRV